MPYVSLATCATLSPDTEALASAETSHRIARRNHPYRYAARVAYNAGSIYKTYRGW